MSNFVEFGAGAAGGLAGTITGYPFDTVKVRQQCSIRQKGCLLPKYVFSKKNQYPFKKDQYPSVSV